jgi:hypothetical protein
MKRKEWGFSGSAPEHGSSGRLEGIAIIVVLVMAAIAAHWLRRSI